MVELWLLTCRGDDNNDGGREGGGSLVGDAVFRSEIIREGKAAKVQAVVCTC